jgi:hypothetical protein
MTETYRKMSKWSVVLACAMVLIVAGYFCLPMLAQWLDEKVSEGQMFHSTTGTVTRKEHVRFDETNHSYIGNLGDRIEVRPGDEQWRVYYEFDNFDQLPEPKRSRLMRLERERIANGRVRHWFDDKEWYDSIKVGDKLIIGYKPFDDGKIEVANVSKANE